MKLKKTKDNSIKLLSEYTEHITLRNTRIVIIICAVASLICEFLPDLIDVCKMFGYANWILYLQPHKDFFSNISLGCLGSAIISYIMLHIPYKIKEEDEKKKLIEILCDIICEFQVLVANLQGCFTLEDIKLTVFENNIKDSMKHLYELLEMLNKKELSYVGLVSKFETFVELSNKKIKPILDEITVFYEAYEPLKEARNGLEDMEDVERQIYKYLFDKLELKYQLEKVRRECSDIVSPQNAAKYSLRNIQEEIEGYKKDNERAMLSLQYTIEIGNIYKADSEKKMREIL